MTRPSLSLNWYEPGASGIVPAGGRTNVTFPFSLPRSTIRRTPAWYPATYQLRGRQPRGWATRLSPPAAVRSLSVTEVTRQHVPAPGPAPRAVLTRFVRRSPCVDRRGKGDPRLPS